MLPRCSFGSCARRILEDRLAELSSVFENSLGKMPVAPSDNYALCNLKTNPDSGSGLGFYH
jgi:hypothetical protein